MVARVRPANRAPRQAPPPELRVTIRFRRYASTGPRYSAVITSGDRHVGDVESSRVPFCDGARVAKATGLFPDSTRIVMVRENSDVVALHGELGRVAGLTVSENVVHRFVPYQARPATEEDEE